MSDRTVTRISTAEAVCTDIQVHVDSKQIQSKRNYLRRIKATISETDGTFSSLLSSSCVLNHSGSSGRSVAFISRLFSLRGDAVCPKSRRSPQVPGSQAQVQSQADCSVLTPSHTLTHRLRLGFSETTSCGFVTRTCFSLYKAKNRTDDFRIIVRHSYRVLRDL